MLTKYEMKKIFEEEKFRKQAREDIENAIPKTKSKKVLEFLNSNFGIFILSSILLGGITLLYNNLEADAMDKRVNKALKDKLKIEINTRVAIINNYKYFLLTGQSEQLFPALFGSKVEGRFNSFTEFKEKTIIELIYQYDILANASNEKIEKDRKQVMAFYLIDSAYISNLKNENKSVKKYIDSLPLENLDFFIVSSEKLAYRLFQRFNLKDSGDFDGDGKTDLYNYNEFYATPFDSLISSLDLQPIQ